MAADLCMERLRAVTRKGSNVEVVRLLLFSALTASDNDEKAELVAIMRSLANMTARYLRTCE